MKYICFFVGFLAAVVGFGILNGVSEGEPLTNLILLIPVAAMVWAACVLGRDCD